MSKRKIAYIINPHSGIGKKNIIEGEIEHFTNKDEVDYQIIYTEYAGHAHEISASLRDKVDIVVAVGGDGTVNEVGRGLIGSQTALGIIPCGSGNGLARELDIPLRSQHAIEIINESITKQIDVIKIGDSYSLNVAGIGFDAYISHKFAKVKTRGPLQYMNLIAREYPKYKSREYVLDIDSHIFQRKAFFISFANSTQWGNNVHIAPGAMMDDGLIDVCIVSEFPNYAIPTLLVQLLSQNIDANKYDEIIKAKEIDLCNKRAMLGHADGEPIRIPPHAKVSILPLALKVVVPSNDFFESVRFAPAEDIKKFIQQTIPLQNIQDIHNRVINNIQDIPNIVKDNLQDIPNIVRKNIQNTFGLGSNKDDKEEK
ncbi:MAG: YegS/Rv2252/BmrU family lipid kinase [Bacteroidales bacterium]|nr:YegS/Rv2252/BmrU family lipid kinase [Bacteroidales bacterium]